MLIGNPGVKLKQRFDFYTKIIVPFMLNSNQQALKSHAQIIHQCDKLNTGKMNEIFLQEFYLLN